MSKALACAVLVVACLAWLPGAAADEASPRTAVVGTDFEPPCLNVLLDPCQVLWTHAIAGSVLAGAYRERPDFTFEPVLVERVEIATDPVELTYHVRPDAVWSDGVPVTADDFVFTFDAIRDSGNATNVVRQAYANVTGVERVDAKTLRVSFSRFDANWQRLFSSVLPKHVLEGHDVDDVFRTAIVDPDTGEPIGSGAFLFGSWDRGVALTLVENQQWWGTTGPFLDAVVFRPLPDVNAQFQGIRDGTIDVIYPQPQAQIADVMGLEGVVVDWRESHVFEHVTFNVQSATMPLLQESWFRRVLAFALDREGAVEGAYEPLVSDYPVLQSLRYRSLQPEYEATYAGYVLDGAAVAALMTDNGCALGGDGIWVCDGVRASVKLAASTGSAVREHVQARLIERARTVGIELVADNSPGSVFFGTRLPAGQFEAALYAWVAPVGSSPALIYSCSGASNFARHCSPDVDALIARAEATVDPSARAALYNEAYRILAAEVPTIPLLARPSFQVRRDRLVGPELNVQSRPTWNIEAWRIASDDATPPTITCAADPSRIWFHKGKLVPVRVDVAVADDGSGVAGYVLDAVTSDEPGDDDIRDFVVGTPDTEGLVRAERDPEGDGRVYTFRYVASDRAGNTALCEATLEVVHRGAKKRKP